MFSNVIKNSYISVTFVTIYHGILPHMDKENMEFKMRGLSLQITTAEKYIRSKMIQEPNQSFNFMDKVQNNDDIDSYFAWQLEVNVEIVFVKTFVFLEYLEELELDDNYKVNKKLLNAGLRAYVAHMGTPNDFQQLNLPANKLVVTKSVHLENDDIILTLLSGNHTEKIPDSKVQAINLTKSLFKPHLEFVKEYYPDWFVG